MSRKSVADHFIISDQTANAMGNSLATGSFLARLFFYIFLYILIWLIMIYILSDNREPLFSNNETINNTISWLLLFGVPAIIPFFTERAAIKNRKKLGVSIYGNISKELEQKEIDERVAMEKKAYEKAGVNQGVDKNDIGYWFDLKERGAITEDEFNEKKAELLAK